MERKQKFRFAYGNHNSQTVTVDAVSYNEAILKAKVELDRRYARRGLEPPVAWTLIRQVRF